MKVSIDWLNNLVEIKDLKQVLDLLPLRTIATKEVTDSFIELDMKGYNRADLLSLRGVAYEIAAITDSKVKFEELTSDQYLWVEKSLPSTPVKVFEEELCPVQCVAKIEGLKVEKSSEEWVKTLADCGMRSVNNIADVTNLVMLEYGHPLHAFDASSVKDDTINIRRAKAGEEIITLDGKLRKLITEDIVLADEKKALDVAGVMGGEDTEIKDSTNTILLSASLFNPSKVQQTSKRLRLQSEASKRFYHGLTRKRLFQALNAAIKMYQGIGGKLTALTIVGESIDQVKKIPLSLSKVNNLIGVEISANEVEDYLKKLNFELKSEKNAEDETAWVVTPPYYRLDIEIEEDLVEEVARMYGYEKIPAKELVGEIPKKVDQKLFELIQNLKDTLVEEGITEIQTYPYFSTHVLANYGWTKDDNLKHLVKIENPISAETEYLRQNLWSNLLEKTAENLKYFKEIAIFEIGKIYWINPNKGDGVDEKYSLAVSLVDGTSNPLAKLNTIFEKINNVLKLNLNTEVTKPQAESQGLFHPTRLMATKLDGKQIGGLGEVHPRLTNKFGIEKRVAAMEFNLRDLLG